MQHLAATVLPRYINNTLILLSGVAVISFICAVPTAWLLAQYHFPGARALQWMMMLPLAIPPYIAAFVYAALLEPAGPIQTYLRVTPGWMVDSNLFPSIRSLGGACLVLALVCYPYLYAACSAAFRGYGRQTLEAARLMGTTEARLFWKVALPLARPALVAGMALVLMETLADFGGVYYLGVDTFTTGIYRTWFGLYDQPAAMQLAAMLLLPVIGLLMLERYARRQRRYQADATPLKTRQPLHGMKAIAALCYCALPVLAGFIIPLGAMIWLAAHSSGIDASLLHAAMVTVKLAISGALIVVIAALTMVILERTSVKSNATLLLSQCASSGYAIPGTVIAAGLLTPVIAAQQTFNQIILWFGGESAGLFLSGTVIILLYAYLVRFLALGYQTLHSGMSRIDTHLDDSARMLGAGDRQLFRHIHWPLLRPSLLVAFMLVAVEVIKELPATLILRPFNMNSLAIRAFELAADERLHDAAAHGIIVVIAGMVPVIWLGHQLYRVGQAS